MKRVFLVSLVSLGIIQLTAQNQTDAMLFGDVKSSLTGEHIPYATIIVKGTTFGASADGTGHYKLAHLPLGKNLMVAQAVGFKSAEVEVFMERNKAVEVFFVLEEDVLNLEQVVVTGTRTSHFVKDVPVRTEVITAKAIENKNASNIS